MINLSHIHLAYERTLIEQGELRIYNGQITGIIGESGCGKTTLLQIIGLLGQCKNVEYDFDGTAVHNLSSYQRAKILRQDICFVMQDIYLFKGFTVYEIMKLYASFVNDKIDEDGIYRLLHRVRLHVDIHMMADTLSGGEKQRLCIACGLLKEAKLFIFDEPFANLDQANVENIFEIIQNLAYKENKMVVISTHDEQIFSQFDRIYQIANPKLLLIKETPTQSQEILSHNVPFRFSCLKSYVNLYNKKHQWKNWGLCIFMSMIISLLIIIGNFNSSFQKVNGSSLLSLMKNEVVLVHSEGKAISVKEQTKIRSLLSSYQVYGFYIYEDNQGVVLKSYLENEKDSFQIHETVSKRGQLNDKEIFNPIYMSYALYRKLDNINQYQFIDHNQDVLSINASHILKPSEDGMNSIYIPYDQMQKFFKEKGIDMGLLDNAILKIPIESISDITDIEKEIPDEYQIMNMGFVDISIKAAQIFEKSSVNVFIYLVLFLIFLYKIFDIIKIKHDLILFKISGIDNRNLFLMKVYQEGVFYIKNFILSVLLILILSWWLNILMLESFFDMIISMTVWNGFMYVFLLIIYTIGILMFTPAYMLRKNKEE